MIPPSGRDHITADCGPGGNHHSEKMSSYGAINGAVDALANDAIVEGGTSDGGNGSRCAARHPSGMRRTWPAPAATLPVVTYASSSWIAKP